jgi:tetratricopeptide (TPR) repeat protein
MKSEMRNSLTWLAMPAIGAALLLGVVFVSRVSQSAGDLPSLPSVQPATLDSEMARLQARLKDNPDDANSYALLGTLMLQKARESADATWYAQADTAFNETLKHDAQQQDALIGKGSLALSRHEFVQAVKWGERAIAANPYRAQAYGVLGDAQVELGRYEAALRTIQKMVDTRPDIASYSRVSYLRELHGDVAGAIDAMRRAVNAGAPGAEGTLWAQVQLGVLYFNKGDLQTAEALFGNVLQQQANYAPAQAAIAKVRAAQGRADEAVALYQTVLSRLPMPQYAIELGEFYEALGRRADAKAQYDLVRAIQQINANAQMNTDLEMALFEADHGNPVKAVALARAAYQQRPSIHGADALAWALYRNGHFSEASTLIKEALKLGTQDAMLHYHAGMIALEFDANEARQHLQTALVINPHFSIHHAPLAEKTLKQLGK